MFFSEEKKLAARAREQRVYYFFGRFKVFQRGHAHEISSVQPIKPISELTRVNRYLIRRLTSYRFAKLLFVRGCSRGSPRTAEKNDGRGKAAVVAIDTFHCGFSRDIPRTKVIGEIDF